MFAYNSSHLNVKIDDKAIELTYTAGLPLGSKLYKTIYVRSFHFFSVLIVASTDFSYVESLI